MYPIVDSICILFTPFADASGGDDDGGRSLLESDWRDRRLSWSSLLLLFIPKDSKRFLDRHNSPAESVSGQQVDYQMTSQQGGVPNRRRAPYYILC